VRKSPVSAVCHAATCAVHWLRAFWTGKCFFGKT
jgi:hypothetical protein